MTSQKLYQKAMDISDAHRKKFPNVGSIIQRLDVEMYRRKDERIGVRQIGTTQRIPSGLKKIGEYRCGIPFNSDRSRDAYFEYVVQRVADSIRTNADYGKSDAQIVKEFDDFERWA